MESTIALPAISTSDDNLIQTVEQEMAQTDLKKLEASIDEKRKAVKCSSIRRSNGSAHHVVGRLGGERIAEAH